MNLEIVEILAYPRMIRFEPIGWSPGSSSVSSGGRCDRCILLLRVPAQGSHWLALKILRQELTAFAGDHRLSSFSKSRMEIPIQAAQVASGNVHARPQVPHEVVTRNNYGKPCLLKRPCSLS